MRDMLAAFTRTLDESNQELMDEVRMELTRLRREIEEVRAELRIARSEAALALESAPPRGRTKAIQAAPPEPAPEPEPELPDLSQELQDELRQRHDEIWRLLKAGENAVEVARRTNRPIGEVELIMRLIGPKPGLPARRGR